MDWLASPEAWIALLTLTALEIVLGVDNIIFISILVGRLPPEQRARARIIGLGLAMVSDTAAAYGGELRISASEDLGGARVEVRLPGRSLAASA